MTQAPGDAPPPTPRDALAGDLADVTEATARLILAAEALDADDLAAPSLLPGWTRAHVLGHVARNAEGMVRLVDWALTGPQTPMYASTDDREAGIASAAALEPGPLRALLLESATALGSALIRLRDAGSPALDRLVLFGAPPPGAVPDTPAWQLGWARLREVEIHHVDLDAGYGPSDWPPRFVARLSHFLDTRSPAPGVEGPLEQVVAWRLGRGAGPDLRAGDGSSPGEPVPW